jgi:hypothetical protein
MERKEGRGRWSGYINVQLLGVLGSVGDGLDGGLCVLVTVVSVLERVDAAVAVTRVVVTVSVTRTVLVATTVTIEIAFAVDGSGAGRSEEKEETSPHWPRPTWHPSPQ